jgi:hypothetical protein
MDHRVWMYVIMETFIISTFMLGLSKFFEVADKYARVRKTKYIHCPNKLVWDDTKVIKMHLIKRGFVN